MAHEGFGRKAPLAVGGIDQVCRVIVWLMKRQVGGRLSEFSPPVRPYGVLGRTKGLGASRDRRREGVGDQQRLAGRESATKSKLAVCERDHSCPTREHKVLPYPRFSLAQPVTRKYPETGQKTARTAR